MRVVHICLSCFYIDEQSYQENELIRQHVTNGHDVLVISSTECFSSDGEIIYTTPREYIGAEGARVVRLRYSRILPEKIMRKLRINIGVYEHLREFRPDVILFHGTCGWELRTAARYVRDVPSTRLFVDSHEDWNNSARGFFSREILHRHYYGRILRRALPWVQKILCVSTEAMDFVAEVYRIPPDRLEFFPLGGQPILDENYFQLRQSVRESHGLSDNEILLVQSGKQTKRKKLTESLRAISSNGDTRLRLFIAGVLDDDIRSEVEAQIERDSRIKYLGWQSVSELTGLLCAADVYLQPGTQSVTMQHSLCCRCAIILDNVPAHQFYLQKNGWLISEKFPLKNILKDVCRADLVKLGNNSFLLAQKYLDYAELAVRVFKNIP